MSGPNDLVIIFSSNPYEAEIAKNELENQGIIAFVKDELLGTIAPWHSAPGGAGAVSITVAKKDSEKAKSILKEVFERD
jgi:hypothetical protein